MTSGHEAGPGPKRRGLRVVLGLGAVLAGIAGLAIWVIVRSDAILGAAQAAPASTVRAATTAAAIEQGRHLTEVTACGVCHRADLTGDSLIVSGSTIPAPNLTQVVRRRSDAELDRAIRHGLRPERTGELVMPSHAYAALSDDQMSSIIGYLRSLPPQGTVTARPPPGLLMRAALAGGLLKTEPARLAQARPAIDAGPRFQAGRQLAVAACGQCHGTDLGGGPGFPGPDLTVRAAYDRTRFRTLMRTGATADGDSFGLMPRTARSYFSHFTDGEIDAVYDYLAARDAALSARRRPPG